MKPTRKTDDGSEVPAVESKGTTSAGTESDQTGIKLTTVFDGLESNVCRRCGRHLTAKKSRRHGYGDTCFRKVQKGDLRRAKAIERCEPRTVTDDTWAQRVIRAIYSLVHKVPLDGFHARCTICGTTIHEMPVESFDTDDGLALPGFGKPQWFYLHDDHYDLAVWKLRIYDEDILAELERQYPGQVPPMARPPAAASQRPIIVEEPLDRACPPGIPCRGDIAEEAIAGGSA